jgi:dCTP diphosphatase
MPDDRTTVAQLREAMARFIRVREWDQFHSPKNLAMALGVEAAELMEHFLWIDNDASRRIVEDPATLAQVADEIADVSNLISALCNSLGLDLSDAIQQKMARNELKYPVEKCRGKYRVDD